MTNPDLGDGCHALVMDVFSTIASPVFSELVIVFPGDTMTRLPEDVALLETLKKMNESDPSNW